MIIPKGAPSMSLLKAAKIRTMLTADSIGPCSKTPRGLNKSPDLHRRIVIAAVCKLLLVASSVAASSQQVIAPIPAQEGLLGHPMTIAVNPFTQLLYIAGNGVEVVDQRTSQPVTTFSVGQNQLRAIAINPVTRKLYVADWNTGVYIIDLTTNTVISQFPIYVARWMIYNPLTNLVYALDNFDNIWVLDGTTGAMVKEIETPPQNGFAQGFTMVLNPATNLLYMPITDDPGLMYVVNVVANAVTSVPLEGFYPGYVAVDPLRNFIYATDQEYFDGGEQVEVMNGATNTDTAFINPIPAGPEVPTVDPLTRLVYLTDVNSNVYVINGNTDMLTSTVIPVGTDPIFSTLDLVHGILYVGNTAEYQPGTQSVSVISPR
jgi:DNA-binding beta-propeller fold protein YncE